MENKGEVFYGEDGHSFVVRCPECLRENYAMSVATGQCCWCGYIEPNKVSKNVILKN